MLKGRRNTYYASIAKALASDVANKNAADAVQVRVRPWPNDQTLFVKHWKFECEAKCLTVFPHQNLARQTFLLGSRKNCFSAF